MVVVFSMMLVMLEGCAVYAPPATFAPFPSPLQIPISPLPAPTVTMIPSPLEPTTVSPIASPTRAAVITIGQTAPDFNLPQGNSVHVRLSQYRDKSSVVLVFYRGQT
jgi:hypothetical protein